MMRALMTKTLFVLSILLPISFAVGDEESGLSRPGFIQAQLQGMPPLEKGTRFAIIGYTYGLIPTPEARKMLIEQVNSDEVDHVFILGDADLWDDDVVSQYKSGFNAPVYFAPGNHETMDDEREEEEQHDQFLANVGYDNNAFSERDINFITINSGEDVVKLNSFLAESFQNLPSDRPTVMLGHHRIWDDNGISAYPNSQYKSYPFAELLPELRERVSVIFAGNSARIYFGTFGKSFDKYGNIEAVSDNIVFWCDVVEGVQGCSVGMKGPFQAGYVVATVVGGEVTMAPRAFQIMTNTKKIVSAKPTDRTGPRVVRWFAYVLGIRSIWLAMGVGGIAGIVLTLVICRLR